MIIGCLVFAPVDYAEGRGKLDDPGQVQPNLARL